MFEGCKGARIAGSRSGRSKNNARASGANKVDDAGSRYGPKKEHEAKLGNKDNNRRIIDSRMQKKEHEARERVR